MTDKVQKIRDKVEKLKSQLLRGACSSQVAMETRCKEEAYNEVLAVLDTMQEEPVSDSLEKAATKYAQDKYMPVQTSQAFKAGAKWQKENLWKPADGDDLPEIDREVVVLYQPYPCEGNEYAVGFGHRPKEYWDGRNIETDEVTRYYPKRYNKGGWNIPNIKYWLDVELPKEKEL